MYIDIRSDFWWNTHLYFLLGQQSVIDILIFFLANKRAWYIAWSCSFYPRVQVILPQSMMDDFFRWTNVFLNLYICMVISWWIGFRKHHLLEDKTALLSYMVSHVLKHYVSLGSISVHMTDMWREQLKQNYTISLTHYTWLCCGFCFVYIIILETKEYFRQTYQIKPDLAGMKKFLKIVVLTLLSSVSQCINGNLSLQWWSQSIYSYIT